MRLRRHEFIDLADPEDVEPTEHKYVKLEVRMLGAGSSAHEFSWTIGYSFDDERTVDEMYAAAVLSATEICGDGTGVWIGDEGGTIIMRRHLVSACVRVASRPRRRGDPGYYDAP